MKAGTFESALWLNVHSVRRSMHSLLDKKKCIIQSALDLIQEHGFHGCPVSMVAKNAGVAAGTIYTYFENKDSLIIGIYEYVI